MYVIYKITNTVNGKSYIGQHKYNNELNPMGKYKGSGVILHRAYKKYGEENFTIEILYRRIRDKQTIDAMEVYAIEKYKPEYNIAKGGSGGDTFSGASEEDKMARRKRLSESLKNAKWHYTTESLKRIADGAKKRIGRPNPHSEITKFRMSISAKKRCANKHNHWYNNGEKEVLAETCPEGYTSGRITELTHSNTRGYHWFNNGTDNVFSLECPIGYVVGRIKS